MQVTDSYLRVFPAEVLTRYDFLETRNASLILRATNAEEFNDLVQVLNWYSVDEDLDIAPGGNESASPHRLNNAFRELGWREAAYSVNTASELELKAPGSPVEKIMTDASTSTYKVDNCKGRVALDVEWHAKDGNLDRDIAAYRTLYDSGIVDLGAIVTMNRGSMRAWALALDPSSGKFKTTTTTNIEKAEPRLIRGSGGGCPILIVAVCDRTI